MFTAVNLPLGIVYLDLKPDKVVCNSLMIKARWSLAPGHCTSMRSDPDMAYYYRRWRIKYRQKGLPSFAS